MDIDKKKLNQECVIEKCSNIHDQIEKTGKDL